jgi:hypothetical protein
MTIVTNIIYGIGVGLEFVPDEDGNAWILDLLVFRLIFFEN